MYPINPWSQFIAGLSPHMPMRYGLTAIGSGTAASMFTGGATGIMAGVAAAGPAAHGSTPTAVTGGTEGTGNSPLAPKWGNLERDEALLLTAGLHFLSRFSASTFFPVLQYQAFSSPY
jgi:hypothetical protein